MRAVVFHGPGDLRDEEVPVPDVEPGGVVLAVDAALTCGTDVKTWRRGHPVWRQREGSTLCAGVGVRTYVS